MLYLLNGLLRPSKHNSGVVDRGWFVDNSISVGVFEEAEDDGNNKSVEKKVGDRYPVLK